MKRLLLIITIALFCINNTNAQGIIFSHDLEDCIKKAKKENKLVFVDFYTSWCGPCKHLSKNVFPKAEVGNYFNTRFINCKVLCDDKGVGEKLSKKYEIAAYPTLMFIDGDGNIINSMAGAPSADGLINFAKKANKPNNLITLEKEFKKANPSDKIVRGYFEKMKAASRPVKASRDFTQYFNSLSDDQKCSKLSYDLIKLIGITPFTPIFDFFENNEKRYFEYSSKEDVQKLIKSSYLSHLTALQRSDMPEYKKVKVKFIKKQKSYKAEYLACLNIFATLYEDKLQGTVLVEEYSKRGTAFLDKYGYDPNYVVWFSSLLGNLSCAKDKSLAGVRWMEKLLSKDRNPKYLRTYTYVLQRNYRWDQSIKVLMEIRKYNTSINKSNEGIDDQIKQAKLSKKNYK